MRWRRFDPDSRCHKQQQLSFELDIDLEGGTRSPRALIMNGGEAASLFASYPERLIHLGGRDHALEQQARELLRSLGAHKLAREIRVEWNPRLKTCAGRTDYREKLISLNPLLLDVRAGLAANKNEIDCNGGRKFDCLKQSSLTRAAKSLSKKSKRGAAVVSDEVDRTLRHELAHLLAQWRAGRGRIAPHGTEWRRACRDLGIANEARCHNLPFATKVYPPRYAYRCPNCKEEFSRIRRIRRAIACLACCRKHNRGNFDPRFRLKRIR